MAWTRVTNRRGVQFATIVQSSATGAFSGTFPAGRFSTAPVIHAQPVASGGRDFVATVTSVTATGFAGQVRKSQVLLALGDPFVAPGAAVPVHIIANAATQ